MVDITQLIADIRHAAAAVPREGQGDGVSSLLLLHEAKRLVNALEQPSDMVTKIAIDQPSQFFCMRLAVDLQLFERLKEKSPQNVSELAVASGAEAQYILRIARTLAAIGVIAELGQSSFGATAASDHMTIPSVKAGIIHWFDQGLPAIARGPEYFKQNSYRLPPSSTDGPLQYAFKTDLDSYQFWQTQPDVARNFGTFMTGHFGGGRIDWSDWFPQKEEIIDRFDSSRSSILFVDVGGGSGRDVNGLRKRFTTVNGRFVLQDLPRTIDEVGSVLPLDGRIELVKHDFFQPQPLEGACIYYMANILHNWPDDESLIILKNLAAAMTPGYSRLMICDMVLPDTNCSEHGTGLDIGMMYLHSGLQRSESQWSALLKDAGLQLLKVWRPSSSDYSAVVEASRG